MRAASDKNDVDDAVNLDSLAEVQFLVQAQTHPNVIRLLDVVLREGRLGLVFPLGSRSLAKHLEEIHGLAPCRAFFKSALAAGRHIHSRLIIHTDMKPANFVLLPAGLPADGMTAAGQAGLTADGFRGHRVVLVDFGSAELEVPGTRFFPPRGVIAKRGLGVGTWPYRAPELEYGLLPYGAGRAKREPLEKGACGAPPPFGGAAPPPPSPRSPLRESQQNHD